MALTAKSFPPHSHIPLQPGPASWATLRQSGSKLGSPPMSGSAGAIFSCRVSLRGVASQPAVSQEGHTFAVVFADVWKLDSNGVVSRGLCCAVQRCVARQFRGSSNSVPAWQYM